MTMIDVRRIKKKYYLWGDAEVGAGLFDVACSRVVVCKYILSSIAQRDAVRFDKGACLGRYETSSWEDCVGVRALYAGCGEYIRLGGEAGAGACEVDQNFR